MLQEALSYPRNSGETVRTVLIGGLLTLFSFLVVPAIVVFGYLVRVLRETLAGDDEPPVFDEWGDLLVDGLKAFAITIGYFVVPVTVLVLVIASVVLIASVEVSEGTGVDAVAPTTAPDAGAGAAVLVVVLLVTVLALLALLALFYALPAGLANYARTDRMSAAFAFRSLWPVLTSGHYLVAWLLALLVSIGAGVIVGLVSIVPLLGFAAGALVYFYANVVAFRLYADGFAGATPVEDGPDTPAGRPAA